MSEILERMAKAYVDASPSLYLEWDELPGTYKNELLANMRAVLEAMREPSEEMVEAVAEVIADAMNMSCVGRLEIMAANAAIPAMIDAALTESSDADL